MLGSRGSIVPIFSDMIRSGKKVTITDPNMTRFNITMNQALDFVFRALKNASGGEVFVPKLKAYKTGDVKDAIMDLMEAKNEVEQISVRPGEKFHESLISEDELRNTYENKEDYLIIDQQTLNELENSRNNDISKTTLTERYSSDKVELLTKDQIKEILVKENLIKMK